ncbi:tryptophan synthase beta chain 2, chloroplastic [Tanacetum coccineum]
MLVTADTPIFGSKSHSIRQHSELVGHGYLLHETPYHLGVEAAGHDLDSGKHAITLTLGEVRVLHRAMSYLLQDDDGSVAGPHPYPMMVHEFQAVIGKETRKQALEKWGGKPDVLVACVGGGLNAMGLFHEFVDDKEVSDGLDTKKKGANGDQHSRDQLGMVAYGVVAWNKKRGAKRDQQSRDQQA